MTTQPYEANNGQPPEYFAEQIFAELPEWFQARLPLDNELRMLALSINTIIARLSQVQRSDGAVANETIGYDQLKPEVVPGGIGAIRPWADMARYEIKDSVFYNNSWYVCKKAHTASNENRPDVDVPDPAAKTEGEFWVLLHDFSALFTGVIAETEAIRDETQVIKDEAVSDTTQIYDDTVGIKNETAGLLDTKAARVGGETGAVVIPKGTDEEKPVNPAIAMLRFLEGEGFVGFNPETGEWGEIGGSGKPFVVKDADYTLVADDRIVGDLTSANTLTFTLPSNPRDNDTFTVGVDEKGSLFKPIWVTSTQPINEGNNFPINRANSFFVFTWVAKLGKYQVTDGIQGENRGAELNPVALLVVGEYGGGVVFDTPPGYTFKDFETIDASGTYVGLNYITANTERITRSEIVKDTNWRLDSGSDTSGGYVIQASSETRASIVVVYGNIRVKQVVGYVKRYTSENAAEVVQVNGGADIGVKQRHEIDIATHPQLGPDFVGRDLKVMAEINTVGSLYTGWGESPLRDMYSGQADQVYNSGLKAEVENDKIVVYTAGYGAAASQNQSLVNQDVTNKWGVSPSVVSAPCRVKVWKDDRYKLPNYPVGG